MKRIHVCEYQFISKVSLRIRLHPTRVKHQFWMSEIFYCIKPQSYVCFCSFSVFCTTLLPVVRCLRWRKCWRYGDFNMEATSIKHYLYLGNKGHCFFERRTPVSLLVPLFSVIVISLPVVKVLMDIHEVTSNCLKERKCTPLRRLCFSLFNPFLSSIYPLPFPRQLRHHPIVRFQLL